MITASNGEKLAVLLTNGEHPLTANMKGEGLTPHDLLEASLAACTSMTLRLYAERKGWNLASLGVKVSVTKEGADSVISREITFPSETTEEQKTRLLEIASKCPIHKLLSSNIKIETT